MVTHNLSQYIFFANQSGYKCKPSTS